MRHDKKIEKLKSLPQSSESTYCRINQERFKELIRATHYIDYINMQIIGGECVTLIETNNKQR